MIKCKVCNKEIELFDEESIWIDRDTLVHLSCSQKRQCVNCNAEILPEDMNIVATDHGYTHSNCFHVQSVFYCNDVEEPQVNNGWQFATYGALAIFLIIAITTRFVQIDSWALRAAWLAIVMLVLSEAYKSTGDKK